MAAHLYIAYADKDRDHLGQLEVRLRPLQRRNLLTWWRRGLGPAAGPNVDDAAKENIGRADVILLLVSPDLIGEREEELQDAMDQEARGAIVIPILLRATPDWKSEPWGRNAPLPASEVPLSSPAWTTPDDAWVEILDGIRQVLKVSILFLAANPSDTTRLALEREFATIQAVLQQAPYGKRFVLILPERERKVSAGDLQVLLLKHRPDILHFSGHGTKEGALVFEPEPEDGGGAERHLGPAPPEETLRPGAVRPEALARLFGILQSVRCVVLSACYSDVQAEAISKQVDCTIGMSTAIPDRSAIAFAKSFYRALASRQDMKTAFDLGCNEIDLRNLKQGDAPRLRLRDGVNARRVRFVE